MRVNRRSNNRSWNCCKTQYDYLDRYESVDGGWGYYDFRDREPQAGHRLDQFPVGRGAGGIS